MSSDLRTNIKLLKIEFFRKYFSNLFWNFRLLWTLPFKMSIFRRFDCASRPSANPCMDMDYSICNIWDYKFCPFFDKFLKCQLSNMVFINKILFLFRSSKLPYNPINIFVFLRKFETRWKIWSFRPSIIESTGTPVNEKNIASAPQIPEVRTRKIYEDVRFFEIRLRKIKNEITDLVNNQFY